jgi:superfamily I DNA/RNA helicase
MDAMRDARQILEEKGDILPYQSIVVDEAQDLPAEAFKLIRQMIPEEQKNDLFIVGDAHQRIYRHRVVMSRCGIEIRGRAHKLRINYRTTDEIRAFAVNLLEDVDIDDLDGGEDTQWDYKSLRHGEPPKVVKCDSFDDEVDQIASYVNGIIEAAGEDAENPLASVCLVARTQKLVEKYDQAMQGKGISTYRISRDQFDDRNQKGLRVATMHRVKGLEFERVVVAGVNDGVVPLQIAIVSSADEAVREEAETRERALFYVTVTRARNEALITSNGRPSPLLGSI